MKKGVEEDQKRDVMMMKKGCNSKWYKEGVSEKDVRDRVKWN